MVQPFLCFWLITPLLGRKDSSGGAYRFACTALDACVGIDMIDGTFRDSVNRALGKTCAASNARISDYVSHFLLFLISE